MANYYVAPIGTSGTGTIGDPWGIPDLLTAGTPYTQGVALTTLAAGDTLYFRDGSYAISGDAIHWDHQLICPTHSGTNGNPITLRAYADETPVFVLDATTAQAVFGTNIPVINYVRFLGLTVDLSATSLNTPSAFRIAGTGNEIGYCEIVGNHTASTDNHSGIGLDDAIGTWIHHCNVHGITGGAANDATNSAGLEIYRGTTLLVEDNYFHGNSVGILDKDGGLGTALHDGDHHSIYRRNFVTGNIFDAFVGCIQGPTVTFEIYDNVISGLLNLQYLSRDDQIYNNLFYNLQANQIVSGGYIIAIASNDQPSDATLRTSYWNNIVLSAGSAVWGYWDSNTNFAASGSLAPLTYSDYNVYTGTPSWHFEDGTKSLAQMQAASLETHAIQDTAANIFVDQTSYVLKGIYPTAGRYGDQVGPRYSVASILNTARYGPAAMATPSLLSIGGVGTFVSLGGSSYTIQRP